VTDSAIYIINIASLALSFGVWLVMLGYSFGESGFEWKTFLGSLSKAVVMAIVTGFFLSSLVIGSVIIALFAFERLR